MTEKTPQKGIHTALTTLVENNYCSYVSTNDHLFGVDKNILSTEFVTEVTPNFKSDMFINAQICRWNSKSATVHVTIYNLFL